MAANELPPIAGDWEPITMTNTGSWSIGEMWMDRARIAYCVKVEERHCNALGAMHGGAVATFLDGQVIVAKSVPQDPATHTPTISLHVDYLAPPKQGDWLVATVSLVKVTSTMVFTQAIAMVGDRVMARSHAIYRNFAGKDFQ